MLRLALTLGVVAMSLLLTVAPTARAGAGDADFDVGVTVTTNTISAGTNLQIGVFPNYNAGSNPQVNAQNVTMTMTLLAGVNFVSIASQAPGWTCTTPAVGTAGTITCTKATVAPLENIFFNFNTTVSACPAANFTQTATISATNLTTNGGVFPAGTPQQMTCTGAIATITTVPTLTATATATATLTATATATRTPTATGTTIAGATSTATATTAAGPATATATTTPTGGIGPPTPVVPELPPLWLFGSGLLVLAGGAALRRRR